MDNSTKFSRLLLLIVGCFIGFIAFAVGLFFLLKLISATFITIPGFDAIYGLLVTAAPYVIFFSAFLFIFKRIKESKRSAGKVWATIFALLGVLVCFTGLTLKCLLYFGLQKEWLQLFDYNSHYFLMAQLFLIMFATMSLALDGEKEKDWMEKNI